VPDPTSKDPPPRRPRISQDFLEDYRRRRYVDATAELLHEFGRQGPSVTNIVRLAGTARNSFYEVFRGAEDCIAYGIGLAADELFATLDAQGGEGEWIGEVDEAIAGFYAAVAAEPILAELFLIHSAASRVDSGLAATRAGVERFTDLFERGRAAAEGRGGRQLPAATSEYFALAIISLAARRVRDEEPASLLGEAPAMTALVGGFYLGSEATAEILTGAAAELARL
jgi:AcrR family transcriptional regulator